MLRVTSTRIASRNLLDRTCPDVSGDISGGLESCNWTAKNDVGRSLKYDACMHVRTHACATKQPIVTAVVEHAKRSGLACRLGLRWVAVAVARWWQLEQQCW